MKKKLKKSVKKRSKAKTQSYRWLKRGSYSNKRIAKIVGNRALIDNHHRVKYKVVDKGRWQILYVYTNERKLFG